jgi:FAD/FMN-containing dehydrogenase
VSGDGISIAELREAFGGRVIAPGDPEYDRARTVVPGGIDRRPAVIVRPRDADEVARIVGLARESGLELAVRSGGHSGAGHGVTEGGIVLDVSEMKGIEIDPEARTAWAESGATAQEFTNAAADHALSLGFGDTGSVGLGGITLGGGIGFLVRTQGLTIDSLVGAEVVTADGEILRADEEQHPDLFWAIRGGGGNFGVVTQFHFRLHELPAIVGGHLWLPATAETVAGFIAAAEAAPEEVSTIANVMPAPPMPEVPEAYHGQMVIWAFIVHAGGGDAGERAMQPFRALAEPIADDLKERPYTDMYPPVEGEEEYHPTAVAWNMFVDRVDRQVAETIMRHLEASDAALRVAQLRVLGGAMARVPVEATAFAHRRSRIMVNLAAFYEGEDDRLDKQAWMERFAEAMQQEDTGAYVNFLVDEGEARVRAAYPEATWNRLAEIKARYDPENLFRLNQNIPPAGR